MFLSTTTRSSSASASAFNLCFHSNSVFRLSPLCFWSKNLIKYFYFIFIFLWVNENEVQQKKYFVDTCKRRRHQQQTFSRFVVISVEKLHHLFCHSVYLSDCHCNKFPKHFHAQIILFVEIFCLISMLHLFIFLFLQLISSFKFSFLRSIFSSLLGSKPHQICRKRKIEEEKFCFS